MTESKETYQGWTNYATWRVNLEMVDGRDWNEEEENTFEHISFLAEHIQDWCEEALESDSESENTLVLNYAIAFLSEVNWYEIAKSVSDSYPHLVENKA